MIVIIIAGGSGTRLWPLSVPDYPKHLLSIIGNNSLLQNTVSRAKKITSIDKIYISTEASHSAHVQAQLPELNPEQIIVEPMRRDTMPCILNALQFISTRHDPEEPVASIHADHHIRDANGFAEAVKRAGDVSSEHKRITLLGMEPAYADTKYGYIQKGDIFDHENFVYVIQKFKEKPEHATAQEYFESGNYFWNMGYFVAPYSVFRDKIASFASPHWSEQIEKLRATSSKKERDDVYKDFEKSPIDIALMEKVPDLLVMPGTFDWMDVGTFDDVHRASSKDQEGNVVKGNNVQVLDSAEVYVRNDCEKPVAVIGMDNVVVVNTENGLLVMRTDQSQKVKTIVENL